jgi:hypothetical protein
LGYVSEYVKELLPELIHRKHPVSAVTM